MEEDEFRKTYNEVRDLPCPFEKAILSRQCGCSLVSRFNLGEREGVVCTLWTAQQNCTHLRNLLRESARFTLHVAGPVGALPHAREMKVQAGGLRGVLEAVAPQAARVDDIHALVSAARDAYGSLDRLPFSDIVKAIAAYTGRRRTPRQPRRD